MTARAERRAIAALFAVFALFLQLLAPSLALANTNAAGGDVICTASGPAHVGAGGGHVPSRSHGHEAGCDHCVCPMAVSAAAPADTPAAALVRYAVAVPQAGFAVRTCAPGRGLAAPPPPSRGPPETTI